MLSISGRMVFIRLWCISRRCCCHFSSKILELLGIALRYIYMTGFGLCFKGRTLDLSGRMREMRSNQGACLCCAGAKRSRNKRMCSRVELKRGGGMCITKAPRSTSFALLWLRRLRPGRGNQPPVAKKSDAEKFAANEPQFGSVCDGCLWLCRGPN